MATSQTIRLEQPKARLELNIRVEQQDTHDGCLDTELQPVDGPYNRLSISMGQWTRNSTRAPWREDMFGQCREAVLAFARACEPGKREALERLCEIWAEWHLNDLQAGTAKQTEAIGLARAAGEIQDGAYYDTARIALANRGLLEDRGYSYGSKWLVKRVPTAVVSEVLALCERLSP